MQPAGSDSPEGQRSARPRPADPSARVIAVTGAASFAGEELILRLEREPRCRRLLALDLRRPPRAGRATHHHRIDLTLPGTDAELADLLGSQGVDTVVHGAFLSSPTHNLAWAHELEAVGTQRVLDGIAGAGVAKLVMLSTTLVYGARADNPGLLTEQHPVRGQGRLRFLDDKVEAERRVLRFARERPETVVTVLRAAPTIGPTVRNFYTRFFSRPLAPVLMGFDPLLQLLHEGDLVDALGLAVEHDRPGVFNLAADGVLPYGAVLAMLGKPTLPMPSFVAYPLSRALWASQLFDSPPSFLDYLRYLCVTDTSKARRELGFRPRHDVRSTVLDFLGRSAGEPPSAGAAGPG